MRSTLLSLRSALTSRRIGFLVLLSLASGMPYGLVVIALPAWLSVSGVDVKTIGFLTAVQAPYAFKFAWAPLMERWHPPWLGRKRGWILAMQVLLAACIVPLALSTEEPVLWVVALLALVVAFASASQDVAIDGYAVELLDKKEQGLAVGARTALYLVGMLLAGRLAISLADRVGWTLTMLLPAGLLLALLPVTLFSPEPREQVGSPRSLREAVWLPVLGFLRQPRALEIAAFLVLFKLADNLAGALVSPFLLAHGYSADDVGIATATIGLGSTLLGTFVGGVLTGRLGLGRSLWVFGGLQALSNIGYALVADAAVSRPLMYSAVGIEHLTSGMGTGAFGVLLMRLTERRFSATQFALFSSLFALGRTVSGPFAGVFVDTLGWRDFFFSTLLAALPGMIMLQRFVPWRSSELNLGETELDPAQDTSAGPRQPQPLLPALGAGLLGTLLALGMSALLAALKALRKGGDFSPHLEFIELFRPARAVDWLDLVGPLAFGAMSALVAAAWIVARQAPGAPSSSPASEP